MGFEAVGGEAPGGGRQHHHAEQLDGEPVVVEQHRVPKPWQIGETVGTARIAVSDDTAWWVERTLSDAGTVEDGETPEECAARELVEECGLTVASWRKLGEFWAAPDYSTEYVHAYEATELTDVGIGDREEGDDLVTERLPLRGVLAELSDANSLATLALWLQG